MRSAGVVLIFCLVATQINGQSVTRTFYDQDGIFTDSLHSYYYYSSAVGSDKGEYYFTSNSKLRIKIIVESRDEVTRTYFYQNGSVRAVGRFINEVPVGSFQTYYLNGRRQTELFYEAPKAGAEQPQPGIINHWDSLGNHLVNNGQGFCHCNLTPFSDRMLLEDGRVNEGLMEGVWQGSGVFGEDHFTFRELYEQGVLKEGTLHTGDSLFKYDKIDVEAEPRGGIRTFYDRVPKSIRYPIRARRLGIEGIVMVQFIIDSQGKLRDIKVMRGIFQECDDEAVRAVSESPGWRPRLFRGMPVKEGRMLPVVFTLK